ncbi:MAG: hypothetical protein D6781_14245 [Verrucomicrobia bacterium]|nr:MAG: hypothetical protein D6781_14245 [Verrucomicrobiota bacterium]
MNARNGSSWLHTLSQRLPLLGHRNWIVIADAAYPLQTAPGIETIVADTDLTTALKAALGEIEAAPHVRPVVHLDAELDFVTDADAPGAEALRAALREALDGQQTVRLPHEEIIAKLDAAGRSFNILLIKTRETIPYTSVFIELDCGYWNARAESALRQAMAGSPLTSNA